MVLISKELVRFDARGVSVIQRARVIARTLGVGRAARYMRARGWSCEAALWAILGVATRSGS